ncbi:hypothetical protein SteCoe_36455 [Stentor coeruleus]|uniref:Uncharacterized protein n=1 Tax=Stentor coeruleus TaxID=5963 RepID=A0A1R2AQ31_9CILI|nr:hypothetical protein SteCoe_36455 [Stentor coeruleus]
MPKEEIQAKIVVVGDSGSGKSSIISRYKNGTFNTDSDSTIGASFYLHTIEINSHILKLSIWDTAGQERYDSISTLYSRNSQAVILVADATRDDKVESLMKWYNKIVKQLLNDEVLVFVAVNKIDLTTVLYEFADVKIFADSVGATMFLTSAKDDLNITELFLSVGNAIVHKSFETSNDSFRLTKSVVSLNNPVEKKKKCC